MKSNVKQNEVIWTLDRGKLALGGGRCFHLGTRVCCWWGRVPPGSEATSSIEFYVSLNCTFNELFCLCMTCSDSSSAKSMQHFYLNDNLDAGALPHARQQCISLRLAFGFGFGCDSHIQENKQTQPEFHVSSLLSDSPPAVLSSEEDSPTSCYHPDALVASEPRGCPEASPMPGRPRLILMSAPAHSREADSG